MEQAKNWEDVKPITDVNWSGCLLSSNLKRYKLGDIAEIIISSVDKKTKDGEQKVRLCNFVDVYHNWAITKSMHNSFMIASAKEKDIERLSLKKGYVAFTKDSETRDDIGISTYIADNLNNVILGYHCALVKPNEDILSGKYLNAFLHSNYIKKYFELNATGSGMRYTLSIQTLYDMPILLPSLEEQEYIGNIFSTIDRKIELNRSINHNLEAMAKQLYDYWFVQFDFPDENGKPYKSSGGKMVWNEKLKREIPEDWKVTQLGNLCSFRNGINYAKDEIGEPYAIVNVRNISATSILLDGEDFDVITIPLSKATNYILTEKDIVIARSGCPGSTRLLHTSNKTLFCGFIICCTPIEEYLRNYITLFLKILEGSSATTSGGSILQNVSQDTLKSLWIILPSIKLLMIFDRFLKDLIDLLYSNSMAIKILTKQRDELLPLLMNGQVKVGVERSRLNYDLSHN